MPVESILRIHGLIRSGQNYCIIAQRYVCTQDGCERQMQCTHRLVFRYDTRMSDITSRSVVPMSNTTVVKRILRV